MTPTRLRHLAAALLHSLLPPVCVQCRKVGALLCPDCLAALPRVPEPLCPRCGRTLSPPDQTCPTCRTALLQRRPLPQVRATLLFSGPVPDIIHKFKYQGQFALAAPLAQIMVESWPSWQAPINLLLPIPLHPKRKKKRGYNQSELLARHIGHLLDIPVEPNALHRIRHTRPQVGLSPPERRANVAGAFQVDAGALQAGSDKVSGRDILLIDDVFTTGSTLSEAAKALYAAGAQSVSGYCLARPD